MLILVRDRSPTSQIVDHSVWRLEKMLSPLIRSWPDHARLPHVQL